MAGQSAGVRRAGTRALVALNVVALLVVLVGDPTPSASAASKRQVSHGRPTASATATAVPTAAPTAAPSPSPTPTDRPSATPSPTAAPTAAPSPSPTSAANPFVTRCGTWFCLAGRRWSLYGASNLGGLEGPAARANLAVAARLNTLRIVDFLDERGSVATSPFDPARWARVDAAIAAAQNAGLHVLLDLSTYRNLLRNAGLNPYTVDWGPFVTFVAQRSNSLTGVRYADDPTIALIVLAGEVEPLNTPANTLGITTEQVTAFYARTLGQWRALDGQHLLSSGGLLQLDWASGIDWRAIFGLAGDDVCAIHDYSLADQTITTPAIAAWCAALGKPWITEEFGWEQAVGDATRAADFSAMYALQGRYGAAGTAFWNLGTQLAGIGGVGATHDVNPSTPLTWSVVIANAP